jgi:excisionase family DNA binding protein
MIKVLTLKEAAQRLRVDPKTLRQWLPVTRPDGTQTGGKIDAIKLGRAWRIRSDEIDRILQEGMACGSISEARSGGWISRPSASVIGFPQARPRAAQRKQRQKDGLPKRSWETCRALQPRLPAD